MLAAVERYETSGFTSDAKRLAKELQSLSVSPDPARRELAGRIDAYYRNANVRVAISEKLLNRLIPPPNMEYAPVRDTVLGVNLTGMFLCSRAAARVMIRRGARPEISRAAGKIICISSVHERIPWAGHVNYAASKGAIDSFTIGLGYEVAGEGIRVAAIRPGLIDTEIHASGGEPDRAHRLAHVVPMKRVGTADEIANAIVWLISDEASYVTSAILDVSGGR